MQTIDDEPTNSHVNAPLSVSYWYGESDAL